MTDIGVLRSKAREHEQELDAKARWLGHNEACQEAACNDFRPRSATT